MIHDLQSCPYLKLFDRKTFFTSRNSSKNSSFMTSFLGELFTFIGQSPVLVGNGRIVEHLYTVNMSHESTVDMSPHTSFDFKLLRTPRTASWSNASPWVDLRFLVSSMTLSRSSVVSTSVCNSSMLASKKKNKFWLLFADIYSPPLTPLRSSTSHTISDFLWIE